MITKEEKEALAEHFKNRDLYDPSKAPEQQPADFAPRCEDHGGAHVLGMCSGGVAGFDEGGSVPLDAGELGGLDPYSMAPDPVPADGTELPDGAIDAMGSGFSDVSPKRTQDGPKLASLDGIDPYAMNPRGGVAQNDATIPGMDGMASFNTNSPETPLRALDAPIAAPQTQGVRPGRVAPAAVAPPSMPPTAPPPGAGRLAPNEYDDLVKALTSRPTAGQTSMSALAGLADAIESGVARAPGPGFQKQISENQQKQKENLINALREKYEAGFKGQELGQGAQRIAEEGRHNAAGEKIGSEEAAARLAEAKSGLQQNALEAAGRLTQAGGLTGRILGQPSQTQTAINALMDRAGLGGGKAGAGPTVITTRAQYDALPKGTHYVDSKGTEAVKQ